MKFIITNITDNPHNLMRRLGYHPHPKNESFIRRLGSNYFPRLHVYLKVLDKGLEISLHLDQKSVSYQGHKAHSGDYQDSPVLEEEKQRIMGLLNK